MKIKTSELTGTALDWAVAKCEGKNGVLHDGGITRCIVIAAASGVYKGTWKPSINWSQGGPIIEREGISTVQEGDAADWVASVYDHKADDWHLHTLGETPLIAAMRCYLASKLGDELEIPNELIGE